MASPNPPPQCDGQIAEDFEDDNERRLWEYAMKEYRLGGKSQRETAVLMISWAKDLDDLHTEGEVNGLEAVFADLFNYTVVKRQISGDKRPAIQLTKYLADFVHKYDNESTLLIIYYAGHGVPKVPGGLHFAGNRQPGQKPSNRTAAPWHDVEHIIRDAEGDALLIFDCCYAGNLTLRDVRSSRPTRSFEYIAACGSTDETSFPGPESFTSAMIWALTELWKSQKKFSTLELQTKIMNDAPCFPRKQSVLLMERDDPCDQRLVLLPLPSPTNGLSTNSAHGLDDFPQNSVNLRFWYHTRPDRSEIENLANRMKRLMKDKNIDACCVDWLGLRSHAGKMHMNGDAAAPHGFWMSNHSTSEDTSRPNSSEAQSPMDHSIQPRPRSVEPEYGSLVERFGFMQRGAPGMIRRMFQDFSVGWLPVPMCLSLGFYTWYRFSRRSFPFKIW